MSRPLPLQASLSLWRARALRYAGLYVLLSVALLGLRYAGQHAYPQLRDLRSSVAELQAQRDQLELQVQTLTTGPRVLTWATDQGMVPYAQTKKTSAEILPLPALSPRLASPELTPPSLTTDLAPNAPPPAAPLTTDSDSRLEVNIRWK
ncbi:hypothetical protein [Deinococcus sp.]|uniref:hypothetical protein n=1 Tax=Deinococcus sp. TaxID=47478 RepID=UPI003B5A32CB